MLREGSHLLWLCQAWHRGVLGNAYRLAGRPDKAIAAFRSYHARSPGFGFSRHADDPGTARCLDDARETAAQLIAARPPFTVKYWLRTQFRVDTEQLATDLASLRARRACRNNKNSGKALDSQRSCVTDTYAQSGGVNAAAGGYSFDGPVTSTRPWLFCSRSRRRITGSALTARTGRTKIPSKRPLRRLGG